MATEKKTAPTAEEASQAKTMRSDLVKTQANYKGKEHSDLVEVEIIADGNHVKKGQKKVVHPTMAQILKAKGLIADDGKPYERPKFEQKDITVDA